MYSQKIILVDVKKFMYKKTIVLIFGFFVFVFPFFSNADTNLYLENQIIDDGSMHLIQPRTVKIQGNYMYVMASGDSALTIFDISTPASPVKIGELMDAINFPGVNFVAISGNYAFIASNGNSKIHSIDISNKSLPTLIDTLDIPDGVWDISINGNYAYLSSNSTVCFSVVDISDPTNLNLLNQQTDVTKCNKTLGITSSGNYVYVFSTDADDEYLTIYDVTNPASPIQVGSWSAEDAGFANLDAQNILYENDILYLPSPSFDGIFTINVSNKSSPVLLGSVVDATDLNGSTYLVKSGNYLIVSATLGHKLTIVSVLDSVNPAVVTTRSAVDIATPYSLAISGTRIYVPMVDSDSVDTYIFDLVSPIINQVDVSNISRISATISWTTNEPTVSKASYGLTNTYGLSTLLSPDYYSNHSFTLENLMPCSTYHYIINSIDRGSNITNSADSTFSTLCTNSDRVLELNPSFNWASLFSSTTSSTANTADFGAYVFHAIGHDLFIGLANYRPADAGTGMVAKFNGSNVSSVGSVNEQGINEIISFGNTLYVGGVDPNDDWSLGNFYRYSSGVWEKIREGSGLNNVVHTWALEVDSDGTLWAAASSDVWDGGIFKSVNNGSTWSFVSQLSSYRVYDIIRFNGKLYTLYVNSNQDCKLAVSENNGQSWSDVKSNGGLRRTHMIEFKNKLITLGGGSLNNYIYAVDVNGNITSYPLSFNIGLRYSDEPYFSNYNEFAVTPDGYIYTITNEGSIMRSSNLTDWELYADTGKDLLSIGYWSDQDKLIFSSKGANSSVYFIQLNSLPAPPPEVPSTPTGGGSSRSSRSIPSIINQEKQNTILETNIIPNTPVLTSPSINLTRTLKNKMSGNDVKDLQTYLNMKMSTKLIIDGKFGLKTKQAVILFQKANYLVPDGIVGPLTRGCLNKKVEI